MNILNKENSTINLFNLLHMSIIKYEDLKKNFGGSSPSQIAVILKKNNVHFLNDSRGRPITTVDAVNFALGLPFNDIKKEEEEEDHIEV